MERIKEKIKKLIDTNNVPNILLHGPFLSGKEVMSDYIINYIYKILYKNDGIGGGDFILYGGLGSIFGPFSLSIILLFAAILGCVLYFLKKDSSGKHIPLGSCLIIGSILYFFIKKNE